MDSIRLSQKVFAGYGKAAKRVAPLVDVYRPIGNGPALSLENKIGSINCTFTIHTSKNFDFTKPSDFDKPLYHALGDPTALQVGDYLNDPANAIGPLFVASITPAMPPLVVDCNRVISVLEPGPIAGIGASGYGGTVADTAADITASTANETALLTQWPASILSRRILREQFLPEDSGNSMFRVMMPAPAGLIIRLGTILWDDLDNRYVVAAAEKQDLGWRLEAQQVAT